MCIFGASINNKSIVMQNKNVFTWNGWQFVAKLSGGFLKYSKSRHNPEFPNFIEKIDILEFEYNENFDKWSTVFN